MSDEDEGLEIEALVPAGQESLARIEGHLNNFHDKAERLARILVQDVGLTLLKAFTGPIGSIIGDIAGKIEAARLAEQLRLLEARLESLEDAELQRAQSEEAKPFVKHVLRLGMEEPDDSKKSTYVDAFINVIKSGAKMDAATFRALRTLSEMERRHLDLLWTASMKRSDPDGQFAFQHDDVQYDLRTSKLPEIQDLQSWGILIPYQPDTSRTRSRLTRFGSLVVEMMKTIR